MGSFRAYYRREVILVLNSEQQMLIRELSRNPVFGSILIGLSKPQVKRYSPKGECEEKKIHEWIYRSGIDQGTRNVLQHLGLHDD